ncbi:MAG: DUF4870 domain-containing protein [Pirellulales bacterium]|nr:DUF4870 domain-containing protein [Pirellulales bacterium]
MNHETSESTTPNKERETRTWAMFLHFSLLAGYVAPIAGLIAPIIIWQVQKDKLPGIDEHGKVVVNWLISLILYLILSALLLFIFIGIPMLIVLIVATIIFPIIGGIKANDGQLWKYPLSIPFFK